MFKISLSAGHGRDTAGKRCPDNSMHEWEFNSSVVSKMIDLFSHYKDTAVLRLDDPTGKVDIPLADRAKRSNDWGANYHLDVHGNAFGAGWNDAHGIETYSYKLSGSSFEIGKKLQASLIAATGLTNRGVKDGSTSLYMISQTNAPANLVECGFMTNPAEAALLKSDDYRTKVANALVGAIASHFNLSKSAPVTQAPIQLAPTQYGSTGRKVFLPPSVAEWHMYDLNVAPVKANYKKVGGIVVTLKPSKFGGLTYDILRDRGDVGEHWVFEIQTQNFGRVKIYCDPSATSARVI
jgi:N-acetylmuramoyl-L-alanine amidase